MPGLNERVTFYNLVETQDVYGTLQSVEDEIAVVNAKVVPLSGRERDRAQQIEARSNYRITIWRRTDITERTRVRWRGKEGDIRFIADGGPTMKLMSIDVEIGAP